MSTMNNRITNKLGNLDDKDRFLKGQKPSKSAHVEIVNLNRSIISK